MSDYTKQDWKDGTDGGTPITAARLAHIEDGIAGHAHSASDVTSGTLSADRLPTVPIAHGGTGATTAAAALTALGAASASDLASVRDSVSQALGGKNLIYGAFTATVGAGNTTSTVVRDSPVASAWANPQTSNAGAVEATAQWSGSGLTIYVHNGTSNTWSGTVTWFALV